MYYVRGGRTAIPISASKGHTSFGDGKVVVNDPVVHSPPMQGIVTLSKSPNLNLLHNAIKTVGKSSYVTSSIYHPPVTEHGVTAYYPPVSVSHHPFVSPPKAPTPVYTSPGVVAPVSSIPVQTIAASKFGYTGLLGAIVESIGVYRG